MILTGSAPDRKAWGAGFELTAPGDASTVPPMPKLLLRRTFLAAVALGLTALALPAAPAAAPAGALRDDVASALANLGYARADADRALDRSLKAHPEARFEELLREALRLLSGAR